MKSILEWKQKKGKIRTDSKVFRNYDLTTDINKVTDFKKYPDNRGVVIWLKLVSKL